MGKLLPRTNEDLLSADPVPVLLSDEPWWIQPIGLDLSPTETPVDRLPHVVVRQVRTSHEEDQNGDPIFRPGDTLYEGRGSVTVSGPTQSQKRGGISQPRDGTDKRVYSIEFPYDGDMPKDLRVEVTDDHGTTTHWRATNVWNNGYRQHLDLVNP